MFSMRKRRFYTLLLYSPFQLSKVCEATPLFMYSMRHLLEIKLTNLFVARSSASIYSAIYQSKSKTALKNVTLCHISLQGTVPPPATQFSCPKYKRDCVVSQEEAEGLPTNPYALNLAQLRNTVKNKQYVNLLTNLFKKIILELLFVPYFSLQSVVLGL